MQVTLEPDLAKFIQEQVRSGRYDSPDDAINSAVARLKTDRELSAPEVDDLRQDIDLGLEQADRGEFSSFTAEDVIAERRSARAKRLRDE